MQPADIEHLLPGTKVLCGDGDKPWHGVVVFNNTLGLYSGDFPAEDWAYLGPGFMVNYDEAGLVFSRSTEEIAVRREAAPPPN